MKKVPKLNKTLMYNYDVTVIGSSLSGSYTALLLAGSGTKVLLVEKERLPRRKACGEGMAGVAKQYLEKIGLWQDLPSDSYMPYTGYHISIHDENTEKEFTLRSDNIKRPEGYRISRQILDQRVYQKTAESTDIDRKQACVRNIRYENDSWLINGDGLSVRSKFLVMANGAMALPLLKKFLPYEVISRGKQDRFGIVGWLKGHWNGSVPNTVLVKSYPEYQILLTATSKSLLNISILMNQQDVKFEEEKKSELLREAYIFAEQTGFQDYEVIEQRGAASIRSREIRTTSSSVYLVGDSAEVFDPIGGLGMVHAFESAELAAESLQRAIRHPRLSKMAHALYRWRRSFFAARIRLLTAMSYQLNVKRSYWLVSLVSYFPNISAFIFSMLRKTLLFSINSHKKHTILNSFKAQEVSL